MTDLNQMPDPVSALAHLISLSSEYDLLLGAARWYPRWGEVLIFRLPEGDFLAGDLTSEQISRLTDRYRDQIARQREQKRRRDETLRALRDAIRRENNQPWWKFWRS
jgi:hypothetical protein